MGHFNAMGSFGAQLCLKILALCNFNQFESSEQTRIIFSILVSSKNVLQHRPQNRKTLARQTIYLSSRPTSATRCWNKKNLKIFNRCPKSSFCSFYPKRNIFKIVQKGSKYLGYFCIKIFLPKFVKSRPIWQH